MPDETCTTKCQGTNRIAVSLAAVRGFVSGLTQEVIQWAFCPTAMVGLRSVGRSGVTVGMPPQFGAYPPSDRW